MSSDNSIAFSTSLFLKELNPLECNALPIKFDDIRVLVN